MRSIELSELALLNCSYSIIGPMCFKIDGVTVNLRRLRDAAVLIIVPVPRLTSFSNMLCSLAQRLIRLFLAIFGQFATVSAAVT